MYRHGENVAHVAPLAHGGAGLGAGLEHDEGLAICMKMRGGGQTDRARANDGNW